MHNNEIAAHLAGLRIALAFAIKATCRNPAEVQVRVASLQEIAGLIPTSLHPGVKEELDAVIAAVGRLPVRDPAIQEGTSLPAAPPGLREHQVSDKDTSDADGVLDQIL